LVTLPESISAIAISETGGFVGAVKDGIVMIHQDRRVCVLGRTVLGQGRMNDGKCDSAGRFWVGATTPDRRPGKGALYSFGPEKSFVLRLEGLTLPNGMGWSPDDRWFYLADSTRQVILTAGFDAESGSLRDVQQLVGLQEPDGLPDGMTVDLEGCLWVAMWGSGQVRRYTPTGQLVAVAKLPVSQPSSCTFGPDGGLFITSAALGTSVGTEPLAGSVFCLESGTLGSMGMTFGVK
jgi:sugar lactone lactonase YvrE